MCRLKNGGALVHTGTTGMVLTVLCSFHICTWLVCQDVAKELRDKEASLDGVCVFNGLCLYVSVCGHVLLML